MRVQPLKIAFLSFLSLCSSLLFSQPVAVSTDLLKSAKTVTHVQVVGTDTHSFFVAEYDQDKVPAVNLVSYDHASMKEQWRKKIILPFEGAAIPRFEKVVHLAGNFILFSSTYNKSTAQVQAFATMLDARGESLSRPVLVHYMVVEERAEKPIFDMRLSPDSLSILLFFDSPFERKVSENMSFKLYTLGLELLWEKDLMLPYAQDVVQIHNYIIDNEGNLYMMSGRAPQKEEAPVTPPMAQGGRYVLFHYSHVDNKVKEYDVSLKDKQVIAAAFAVRPDGSLLIAGYYGNNYEFTVTGTFQFELNPGGKGIKTASFMPFPGEFLARFGEGVDVSKHRGLDDFYLDHIFPRPDGSTMILGERYFVEENSRFDPTTGRQVVEKLLHFDDIIVTLLEPGGRITWCTKVPKQQYTSGSVEHCSYNCYYDNKNLSLFFNDDEGNIDRLKSLPQGEALAWNQSKKSITTRVTVGSEGQLSRQVAVLNKETSSLLAPWLGSANPYGRIVLGNDAGKNYTFCRLN